MQKRIIIYYEAEADENSRSIERTLLEVLTDTTVIKFQEMQVDTLIPSRDYKPIDRES